MELTLNEGGCRMNKNSCKRNSHLKLSVTDWFCDLPETIAETDLVEVQFKNTRKGYYVNSEKISLQKGDVVAVESSPGHDIGEVTLVGKMVLLQLKKNRIDTSKYEFKKIYRLAKETDLDRYKESKAKEQDTMIKSRQLAESLKLNMKIGDVEYQGDGNKAIFYYIADERVDFRQLIKVLADTFRVRIEMKQIGARQEAGRIGGIGPCGRELCCSSWLSNFSSVTTGAARMQDLSMNPQKLAGQCAKLKCCMNYELDTYADAQTKFPRLDTPLETKDCTYYHFKSDILKGQITYSTDPRIPANLVTITTARAHDIIDMNRKGDKPLNLSDEQKPKQNAPTTDYTNVVGQDSLTRFDNVSKNKRSKSRNNKNRNRQGGNNSGRNNNQQKNNEKK